MIAVDENELFKTMCSPELDLDLSLTTADQWPLPGSKLLLDSVIDLFNLRTLMPVRGHYWSGLRDAGTGQKLQDCEEKRVNNR